MVVADVFFFVDDLGLNLNGGYQVELGSDVGFVVEFGDHLPGEAVEEPDLFVVGADGEVEGFVVEFH